MCSASPLALAWTQWSWWALLQEGNDADTGQQADVTDGGKDSCPVRDGERPVRWGGGCSASAIAVLRLTIGGDEGDGVPPRNQSKFLQTAIGAEMFGCGL